MGRGWGVSMCYGRLGSGRSGLSCILFYPGTLRAYSHLCAVKKHQTYRDMHLVNQESLQRIMLICMYIGCDLVSKRPFVVLTMINILITLMHEGGTLELIIFNYTTCRAIQYRGCLVLVHILF